MKVNSGDNSCRILVCFVSPTGCWEWARFEEKAILYYGLDSITAHILNLNFFMKRSHSYSWSFSVTCDPNLLFTPRLIYILSELTAIASSQSHVCLLLSFRWLGLATQTQLVCLPLITESQIHWLIHRKQSRSRSTLYHYFQAVWKHKLYQELFLFGVIQCTFSLFYDILEFFRHVEELIRLPECFLCYTPSPEAGPVCPTPALTNGFITFGSFNNLAKVLVRSYLCLDKCSTCGG